MSRHRPRHGRLHLASISTGSSRTVPATMREMSSRSSMSSAWRRALLAIDSRRAPAWLLVQLPGPQHFRPAEHRVERRPQLMGDGGDELVLQPVGAHQLTGRDTQILFHPFALGDVGEGAGHAGGRPPLVPDRLAAREEPAVLTALRPHAEFNRVGLPLLQVPAHPRDGLRRGHPDGAGSPRRRTWAAVRPSDIPPVRTSDRRRSSRSSARSSPRCRRWSRVPPIKTLAALAQRLLRLLALPPLLGLAQLPFDRRPQPRQVVLAQVVVGAARMTSTATSSLTAPEMMRNGTSPPLAWTSSRASRQLNRGSA